MLVSTCWLSHLQHDWESPVWRTSCDDIGRFVTIIRYDERGYGLSDWDVTDHSLEARIGDLEAVADHAGLDRFALMGMAQGGPPAISYAARHPERVTRLLFYGSYAGAAAGSIESQEELEAFAQLIKVGWGRPQHTFRRVFTSMMIPGATEEQMLWLDELQRVAASADDRLRRAAPALRGQLPRPAARPRRTDPGAALAARPDERLRARPAAGDPHPGRPAGAAGQRQPHPARRRAGLAGLRRRGARLRGAGRCAGLCRRTGCRRASARC